MNTGLIPRAEHIVQQIYFIRGQKVMFDFDLASLYNVETKRLKAAVRRNRASFPKDFMFALTQREFDNLRTQFASSSAEISNGDKSWGGRRYSPMAFTEQGVAMLSGVLKSSRARKVNIAIMRAFVQMRGLLGKHKDLENELRKLEGRVDHHDESIQIILEAIRQLMQPPNPPRRRIGYKNYEENKI